VRRPFRAVIAVIKSVLHFAGGERRAAGGESRKPDHAATERDCALDPTPSCEAPGVRATAKRDRLWPRPKASAIATRSRPYLPLSLVSDARYGSSLTVSENRVPCRSRAHRRHRFAARGGGGGRARALLVPPLTSPLRAPLTPPNFDPLSSAGATGPHAPLLLPTS